MQPCLSLTNHSLFFFISLFLFLSCSHSYSHICYFNISIFILLSLSLSLFHFYFHTLSLFISLPLIFSLSQFVRFSLIFAITHHPCLFTYSIFIFHCAKSTFFPFNIIFFFDILHTFSFTHLSISLFRFTPPPPFH